MSLAEVEYKEIVEQSWYQPVLTLYKRNLDMDRLVNHKST